jgi:hypothetical protein
LAIEGSILHPADPVVPRVLARRALTARLADVGIVAESTVGLLRATAPPCSRLIAYLLLRAVSAMPPVWAASGELGGLIARMLPEAFEYASDQVELTGFETVNGASAG